MYRKEFNSLFFTETEYRNKNNSLFYKDLVNKLKKQTIIISRNTTKALTKKEDFKLKFIDNFLHFESLIDLKQKLVQKEFNE
jgi:hypothetical protein